MNKSAWLPRLLALFFMFYAAVVALWLWNYQTIIAPDLEAMQSASGRLFAFRSDETKVTLGWLVPVLALLTAYGISRGARWAGSWGMVLTAAVPLTVLNVATMFGAAVAYRPMTLMALLAASLVFVVLWRTRWTDATQRDSRLRTRNLLVGIAVVGVLPCVLAFRFTLKIKAQRPFRAVRISSIVPPVVDHDLTEHMARRSLLNMSLMLPERARITSLSQEDGGSLSIRLPETDAFVAINAQPLGLMMKPIATALGMDPYHVHEHVFWSRWNTIFVIMQSISLPHLEHAEVIRLNAPAWRAIITRGVTKGRLFAEYSLYGKANPSQAGVCAWVVRDQSMSLQDIEHTMNTFRFLDQPLAAASPTHIEEALAHERWTDAQFALAQRYMLGATDEDRLLELVRVSARLESWHVVMTLTKDFLANHPGEGEMNALHEQALSEEAARQHVHEQTLEN